MNLLEKPNRNPELLSPWLYARAAKALNELAFNKIPAHIFEGFRMHERQNWLYASGRTREGKIITNAQAGKSWHQYGLAIDIAFKDKKDNWTWSGDWDAVNEAFKNQGFENLKMERAHYQIHTGFNINTVWTEMKKSGLSKIWAEVEKNLRILRGEPYEILLNTSGYSDTDIYSQKTRK